MTDLVFLASRLMPTNKHSRPVCRPVLWFFVRQTSTETRKRELNITSGLVVRQNSPSLLCSFEFESGFGRMWSLFRFHLN